MAIADAETHPPDPPPPSGDLKTELESFTTLDACVARHAGLDPLVGDALRALGYDGFLRDACRILEAAQAKSAERCAPIDATALRDRCTSVVAGVTGQPDVCPWLRPGSPRDGRDPTCVALGLRDRRLCAAAGRSERARCEAVVSGDVKACNGLRTEAARADCAREVVRWRGVLESGGPTLAPGPPPSAKLRLHGALGTADPARPEVDLAADVEGGVVVEVRRSGKGAAARGAAGAPGLRFEVGQNTELGGSILPPAPNGATTLGLVISTREKDAALVDHAELRIPASANLVAGGDSALRVEIHELDPTRGGVVRFRVRGIFGHARPAYDIDAEYTTFVRDVVPAGVLLP
jgi:hypothetical protein